MTWSQRTPISTYVLGALFGAVGMLILAVPVSGHAATVTVTDCTTAGPVEVQGRRTVLDVRPDDLVLQCALAPLGKSQRIQVRANNITIDGPLGRIDSSFKGRAVDIRADGHITLTMATIEATNSNGRVRLVSETGFTILGSIIKVGGLKPGRELRLECNGAGCGMNLCQSTIEAQRIRVVVDGDIIADGAVVRTRSPRDRIHLESRNGDIIFCGGQIIGDVEGRMTIEACGEIDLSGVELAIGRNIIIDSGLCGAGDILLVGASVRNDFGKRGEIEITAAGGAGQVDITDATLIDDDRSANKNDVSEINGREQLPHEGHNNTVGTPSTDS